MKTATTETIAGHEIVEVLGVVRGSTMRFSTSMIMQGASEMLAFACGTQRS